MKFRDELILKRSLKPKKFAASCKEEFLSIFLEIYWSYFNFERTKFQEYLRRF